MPRLSFKLLQEDSYIAPSFLEIPQPSLLQLPEKVLQFGTGVLLRGLPDYFIHEANKQGIFNGRIVVVKSTDAGSADTFSDQDNLYTLCMRGFVKGRQKEEYIVNSVISRTLSAGNQWQDVLACARQPEIKLIISNTTEVGIQLTDDDIFQTSPASFPGKLTAFLYERFKAFNGSGESGLVIVPCELIVDNGQKLKNIVETLAKRQHLEPDFIEWLQKNNTFCDSLVDRIVPGKPDAETCNNLAQQLGYTDELITASEMYGLWAIAGSAKVKEVLTFAHVNPGVIIEPDITTYRERKLRILNGGHTITVGLGYLLGLNTVKECMSQAAIADFITQVVHQEIVPATPVDPASAHAFADEVLDRFRNPFIVHKLLDITVQYTSKMNMRILPTLVRYFQQFQHIPENMVAGFAAYLLFMKSVKVENGQCFGQRGSDIYLIKDDFALIYHQAWEEVNINELTSVTQFVNQILNEETIWSQNLDLEVPGFTPAVSKVLHTMLQNGVAAFIDYQMPKEV